MYSNYGLGGYSGVRRKVFISYHHADQVEVDKFVQDFSLYSGIFMRKMLGMQDDIINSMDASYVMRRIRQNYLNDSTITIVLLGSCTHSRRYVDWEIKTSLRQGGYTPNGLLGIILPSQGTQCYLPNRFYENWNQEHYNCYARLYNYPTSTAILKDWIEDAYDARTSRPHLIKNTPNMMKYSSRCLTCNITH